MEAVYFWLFDQCVRAAKTLLAFAYMAVGGLLMAPLMVFLAMPFPILFGLWEESGRKPRGGATWPPPWPGAKP